MRTWISRLRGTRLLVLAALIFWVGCPPPPINTRLAGYHRASKPYIRSFSERLSVVAVAEAIGSTFVATRRGLLSFDRKGVAKPKPIKGPQGGPLIGIRALAASSEGGLWVATASGLMRLSKGKWVDVAQGAPRGITVMHADSNRLLLGASGGFYQLEAGKWKLLLPGAKVTTILENKRGKGIWIGTDGEGIYQLVGHRLTPHGRREGQPVRAVRSVAYTALGSLYVLGEDARGRQVIGFYDGRYWVPIWPDARPRLGWLMAVAGTVYLGHEFGVSSLAMNIPKDPSQAPTSIFALTAERPKNAPGNYPMPHFYAKRVKRWLPLTPTTIKDRGDHVLIGTRTLGAASFDGSKLRWYRRRTLLGSDTRLKAACSVGRCFLAGGGKAYEFRGGHFMPFSLTADAAAHVHAFVGGDGTKGNLWAVASAGERPSELIFHRLEGRTFAMSFMVKVKVPKNRPMVRFARTGPNGSVWLGIRYHDESGDERPWGVVSVTPAGKLTYHRSSLLPEEDRPAGSLALPDDIRDVFFDQNTLWFSTGAGICKVRGSEVTQITENEGLSSELVYMLGRSERRELIVASYSGLGRFDGTHWRFDYPEPLDGSTRAVLSDAKGMWIGGGGSGLIRFENGNLRRVRAADGLAGDTVVDIFRMDPHTLWVLADGAVSVMRDAKAGPFKATTRAAPAPTKPATPTKSVAPKTTNNKVPKGATKSGAGKSKKAAANVKESSGDKGTGSKTSIKTSKASSKTSKTSGKGKAQAADSKSKAKSKSKSKPEMVPKRLHGPGSSTP